MGFKEGFRFLGHNWVNVSSLIKDLAPPVSISINKLAPFRISETVKGWLVLEVTVNALYSSSSVPTSRWWVFVVWGLFFALVYFHCFWFLRTSGLAVTHFCQVTLFWTALANYILVFAIWYFMVTSTTIANQTRWLVTCSWCVMKITLSASWLTLRCSL